RFRALEQLAPFLLEPRMRSSKVRGGYPRQNDQLDDAGRDQKRSFERRKKCQRERRIRMQRQPRGVSFPADDPESDANGGARKERPKGGRDTRATGRGRGFVLLAHPGRTRSPVSRRRTRRLSVHTVDSKRLRVVVPIRGRYSMPISVTR